MVVFGLSESDSEFEEIEAVSEKDVKDFLAAAVDGNLAFVASFLLSHPVTALDARDPLGRTAFHAAVEHERLETARALTDGGAEVDAIDAEGRTPLATAAACATSEDVILFLVGEGANLRWKSDKGETLIHIAASRFNPVSTSALAAIGLDLDARRECDGKTPMHIVAESEDREDFLLLLENLGADVRLTDRSGKTPLHLAVEKGFLGNIRFLTERILPTFPKSCPSVVVVANSKLRTCGICEQTPVDVTFFPCGHRTCDRCSPRWKRCHVTIKGSICGIVCGSTIEGRKKIVDICHVNCNNNNATNDVIKEKKSENGEKDKVAKRVSGGNKKDVETNQSFTLPSPCVQKNI